jgi:hypothetical protein
MHMTVQTWQLLQDGGAPEYMYHDRTAWRFEFFVGKKYGSKGYPQINAAHMGSMYLWISFAESIFFVHKKRTTPRCSIVVHVFRGAAIL